MGLKWAPLMGMKMKMSSGRMTACAPITCTA